MAPQVHSATSTPLSRGLPVIEHPGRVHPAVVWLSNRFLYPAVRVLHRPRLDGLENLPPGPFMLVANHSAGLGLAEIHCLLALYLKRFGDTRPIAGFAHPVGFRFAPMRKMHGFIGSVPSTYEAATQTLAAGVPLLVFPGGDHETLRPLWQAHRVDFGGRKGFLKIARTMNVPVVPLGIRGSHFTAPVLWRSTRLLPLLLVTPRLFGVKRWGLTALGMIGVGVILTLPWPAWAKLLAILAWLGSPAVYLPFVPATIRMRVGEPISPAELFSEDDAQLDAALARVQGAVQALVDRRE